jgi:hypothetical protein
MLKKVCVKERKSVCVYELNKVRKTLAYMSLVLVTKKKVCVRKKERLGKRERESMCL